VLLAASIVSIGAIAFRFLQKGQCDLVSRQKNTINRDNDSLTATRPAFARSRVRYRSNRRELASSFRFLNRRRYRSAVYRFARAFSAKAAERLALFSLSAHRARFIS